MKRLFNNHFFKLISLFVLGFVSYSCVNDDGPTRPDLEIPSAYDGSGFAAATTTQTAVLSQLSALATEMKRGRQGETVTKETLDDMYMAGNPSLEDVSTTYYAEKLLRAGGWLDELAEASGGSNYVPGEPQGQGGTLGGYLFDENGLEIEQIVEKGLFGAALYNHATTLFSPQMTVEEVDQVLAIFGATPAFSNSGSSNVAADVRDGYLANYAARRDKNDGNGLYSQIEAAFLKLQAATKAGSEYQTEKVEAISEVKLLWEKANAATIINYCHSTITGLSATNPTSDDVGAALHAYSEAVGFLHGWRTIPQADKRISDDQIDQLLVRFNAPYEQVPTSYKFATEPENELPKLIQVIEELKSLYEFSTQDIEDFKKNWVSEQGR